MRIAIISGKGGTGKSSVISSLAYALSKHRKLVLIDADSDCPNQHILFKGRVKVKKPISVSKIASIDYSKCTGCGACVNACTFRAIGIVGGKVFVNETYCEGCGGCTIICPKNAVKQSPEKSGSLRVIETENFPLAYGHLLPGRSKTGRMVFEARKLADKIAKKRKIELTLIDAPPGIGCPVIASITGCNHVIGIVEPTPTGLANLRRALEVAEHFKIPYSIIMNKEGISKKYEKMIAKRFGKKLIARIPYDEEIPHLLAKGIPPILGNGAAAKSIKELCKKIDALIECW